MNEYDSLKDRARIHRTDVRDGASSIEIAVELMASFAQAEIERQTPAIKLEAIRDTLRNCPDALKEFDALPDKRDAWFCLAFGVTPSLFVDYDSSDPKTERIRLFDDAKVKKWLGVGHDTQANNGVRA